MVPLSRNRFVVSFIIIVIVSIGVYFTVFKKVIPPPTVTEIKEPPALSPVRKTIGSSVEKRNIEAYIYGNGEKHLTFVGGIHGGYEWNSVLLAYAFIDYLNAHPEIIPKNLTIEVLPSVNPDGLFKVTGKEGRFTIADVSTDEKVLASGRFNANDVDINRNFDCKWKKDSVWKTKKVSAGAASFSEPEAAAIRDFMLENRPTAVVFWHSQSNGVYASKCNDGILPETLTLMNLYARASGYPAIKTFDAYEVTGAADDWLSSIAIPAVTVELKTHEKIDWEQNLAGARALIEFYKE